MSNANATAIDIASETEILARHLRNSPSNKGWTTEADGKSSKRKIFPTNLIERMFQSFAQLEKPKAAMPSQCLDCPFRTGAHLGFTREGRRKVAGTVLAGDQQFICHKTIALYTKPLVCAGSIEAVERVRRSRERAGAVQSVQLDGDFSGEVAS